MEHIYQNLTELIGHTPMLEVHGLTPDSVRLLVKIESFNPGGSVKDRIAASMISAAEKSGLLHPGGTIIEPTSGNTGIGLAWVGRQKGYRVVLTMPESMSQERRALLKAYGAELVLTPGADGMAGAVRKAQQLNRETAGSVILGQFSNPNNPAVHEQTTGEEIWNDTDGTIDIFVAGVGTGGTLCGCARCLKRHKPAIEIAAVEPDTSQMLAHGTPGRHGLQGIGANFIPENYDSSVVDRIIPVTDQEACDCVRRLAAATGVLSGISSGAAVAAAIQLAQKPDNAGKTIVALLPDTGDRYLSTPLYQ
ncbi:MAG: cysteine synthase A [bacterium P3]|nr:MAG: cysteine synthase A [bacterium P3]KWW42398.1 MAG: cysteine synthase A [bacterium F083]